MKETWAGALEVKGRWASFQGFISPSIVLKLQNSVLNINYYVSEFKNAILLTNLQLFIESHT